jgi:hypothetical protein
VHRVCVAIVVTVRRVIDRRVLLIALVVHSSIGRLASKEFCATRTATQLGLVMLGRRGIPSKGHGARISVPTHRRGGRHDLTRVERYNLARSVRGRRLTSHQVRRLALDHGRRARSDSIGASEGECSLGSNHGSSGTRSVVGDHHAVAEVALTVKVVVVASVAPVVLTDEPGYECDETDGAD